jgi:hypothetical protein
MPFFFVDAGANLLFNPVIPPTSTVPSAEHQARRIKSTILTRAQHCYSHYANHAQLPVPDSFKVGGLVYLGRGNLTTIRPRKKIDDKNWAPSGSPALSMK